MIYIKIYIDIQKMLDIGVGYHLVDKWTETLTYINTKILVVDKIKILDRL